MIRWSWAQNPPPSSLTIAHLGMKFSKESASSLFRLAFKTKNHSFLSRNLKASYRYSYVAEDDGNLLIKIFLISIKL